MHGNSVRVNTYQWKSWLNFRDDVRSYITESFRTRGPKKFVITGHSLGGALAAICAVDVVVEGLLSREDVILYSYGALRNGD